MLFNYFLFLNAPLAFTGHSFREPKVSDQSFITEVNWLLPYIHIPPVLCVYVFYYASVSIRVRACPPSSEWQRGRKCWTALPSCWTSLLAYQKNNNKKPHALNRKPAPHFPVLEQLERPQQACQLVSVQRSSHLPACSTTQNFPTCFFWCCNISPLVIFFSSLCADSLFLFLLTGELSCFCSLLCSSASHLSYRFFVSGGPHAWLMACCLQVIFICSTLLQPAFVCRRCPLLTHSATPVLVTWKCGVPLLPLSPKWSWFIEWEHRLL